ncbi:MAG: undecaprenyl-phosphate glucose phosphotransferase [Rhodothermia bacterium]|nr:MAG: undecaprenyl-phosphate glucose phosphotransferase [Rhodothermia bacterium]
MSRRTELIFLLAADALALAWANLIWYWSRFNWGWFSDPVFAPDTGYVWILVSLLTLYWLVLFLVYGMYRERYAASRFDELVSLAKVVTFGILVLFFLLFIENLDAYSARSNLFFYFAAVFVLVATGRVFVRSVQKLLILRGYGLHRTLIVGWSDILDQLYEEVARYPEAGLDIVGALRLKRQMVPSPVGIEPEDGDLPSTDSDNLSSIQELPKLIDDLDIQDVLIALGADDGGSLMEVLRLCDGKSVSLKLVPDFYTIIGGMARTEHMYGLPLIEVLPEPMQAWEESLKRLLDLMISGTVLVVGLLLWSVIGVMIRLTSSGPAIYRQYRVGQHGREFVMYKFRTMRNDAEAKTGPVWAAEDDPRYTRFGRWLRKWRIDEIPQMWNVFKGDMSLVGPRPERPFFVEKFSPQIPLYSRRHRVKPGITGWAQVKWRYDSSLDDVRQKVKFDLFYIENMSFRRDLQILFRTVYTAIRGAGR